MPLADMYKGRTVCDLRPGEVLVTPQGVCRVVRSVNEISHSGDHFYIIFNNLYGCMGRGMDIVRVLRLVPVP